MAQWFWKRRQECEKVETRTDRQTNRQTGTGQNVIRKSSLAPQLGWANKTKNVILWCIKQEPTAPQPVDWLVRESHGFILVSKLLPKTPLSVTIAVIIQTHARGQWIEQFKKKQYRGHNKNAFSLSPTTINLLNIFDKIVYFFNMWPYWPYLNIWTPDVRVLNFMDILIMHLDHAAVEVDNNII